MRLRKPVGGKNAGNVGPDSIAGGGTEIASVSDPSSGGTSARSVGGISMGSDDAAGMGSIGIPCTRGAINARADGTSPVDRETVAAGGRNDGLINHAGRVDPVGIGGMVRESICNAGVEGANRLCTESLRSIDSIGM